MLKPVAKSNSPTEVKKFKINKNFESLIALDLSLEFKNYIKSKNEVSKIQPAEALKLKEQLNIHYLSNQKKEKALTEILTQISLLRTQSIQNYNNEQNQIQVLETKIIEIEQLAQAELLTTKKMERMELELEHKVQLLNSKIKLQQKILTKATIQASVLVNNKFYFKNNESIASSSVNSYKNAVSRYREDADAGQNELKNSLGIIKSKSDKIIKKIEAVVLENQEKTEIKSNFMKIISSQEENAQTKEIKSHVKETLNNFTASFCRLADIMNIKFSDINQFTNSCVKWLKKAEFHQMSLTMHYIESSKELVSKNNEYQKYFMRITALQDKNKAKFPEDQAKKTIFFKNSQETQVKSLEKLVLNCYYQIFFIVNNIYRSLKSIENTTKTSEFKFTKIKHKIQETLARVDIIDLDKKNIKKNKNSNSPSSGQEKAILDIFNHFNQSDSETIADSHRIAKKNIKSILNDLTELLHLIKEVNVDILANLPKSSGNQKLLSRHKSLIQARSRVSFLVPEEKSSVYQINQPDSPDIIEKQKSVKSSAEEEVPKHKKSNSESQYIDSKINSFRIKQKKISGQLFGIKSAVNIPKKFSVRSHFFKKIYNNDYKANRSSSLPSLSSPNSVF